LSPDEDSEIQWVKDCIIIDVENLCINCTFDRLNNGGGVLRYATGTFRERIVWIFLSADHTAPPHSISDASQPNPEIV